MTPVLQAFEQVVFNPEVWAVIVAAALFGVFIGATPGLTATMAIALLVPVTYWLPAESAVAAIVTMVACAIFAGDIPTTLLRIPGTPASAAYADDAYAFTQRGQGQRALGVCLLGSVVGGLFGAAILMLIGRPLASLAEMFSAAEYFWLYLMGLSCAVLVSRGPQLHAVIGLLIGLLLSTVGLSAVHTEARFTFGRPELYRGINFIPAMIGLFGVSEILKNLLTLSDKEHVDSVGVDEARPESTGLLDRWLWQPVRTTLGTAAGLMWRRKLPAVRSGGIGSLIGMLPGAGADIASYVSLAVSKRKEEPSEVQLQNPFPSPLVGEGECIANESALNGIADATTANSSSLAAAWIPALVFGIPGDSITAIVIGVLQMKNVQPGAQIFNHQASLVYGIYITFILANLVLLPVGLLAIRAGGLVVRVPRRILLPIILLFCILGSFAINGSYFDVGIMLVMGLLGFFLERQRVPLAPVVLGIILGRPLEEKFIQTFTGPSGVVGFVDRPFAAVLGMVCLVLWLGMVYRTWKQQSMPS